MYHDAGTKRRGSLSLDRAQALALALRAAGKALPQIAALRLPSWLEAASLPSHHSLCEALFFNGFAFKRYADVTPHKSGTCGTDAYRV